MSVLLVQVFCATVANYKCSYALTEIWYLMARTTLGHLASETEFRGTPGQSYLTFIKLELLGGMGWKTGQLGRVCYCVFRRRGK